jgi:hypothetical protein
MMRIALTAIIIVVVTLSGNPVYSACESTSCVTVGSDLGMKLCVEYQAKSSEFKLDYVPDKSDFLWKMDITTLKPIESSSGSCIQIDKDAAIKICCAYIHT